MATAQTIRRLVVEVSSDVRGAVTGLRAVDETADSTAGSLDRTERSFAQTADRATVLRGALLGVGAVAAGSIFALKQLADVGMQVDTTFATIQATSGATAAEMEEIRQTATRLGADLPVSLSDAAEAFREMSFAGLSAKESIQAAGAVAELASASTLSIAEAARTTTSAMNQFGLEANQAGSVANSMAATFAMSALTMEELGASLEYVGASASAAGQSLIEINAALGTLADAGLRGSMAGTALQQVFSNIASPSNKAAEAMSRVGLQSEDFLDSQGDFKDMTEIMQTLADSMEGLSEAERLRTLTEIFGERGARAVSPLINDVDALREKVQGVASADLASAIDNLAQLSDEELAGRREAVMFDIRPNMDYEAVVRQLQDLSEDLSREELVAQIQVGFGVDERTAELFAERLEAGESVESLTQSLEDATTAGELAAAQMETVAGKVEALRGNIEGVAYQMYGAFAPAIGVILDGLLSLVNVLAGVPGLAEALGVALFAVASAATVATAGLAALWVQTQLGAARLALTTGLTHSYAIAQWALASATGAATAAQRVLTGQFVATRVAALAAAASTFTLTGALGVVASGLWAATAGAVAFMAALGPIGWVALAAGAILLGAALLDLGGTIDFLMGPFNALIGVVTGVLGWVWDLATALFDLGSAIGGVALDVILLPLQLLYEALDALTGGLLGSFTSGLSGAGDAAMSFLAPLINLPETIRSVASAIRDFDVREYLTSLEWSDFVPSLNLGSYVTGVEWRERILSFDWRAFVSDLRWVDFVPSLYLLEWVTGVDWRDRVAALEWSDFIPSFDWYDRLAAVDWRAFIGRLRWVDFIPSLYLAEWVTGVDWRDRIAALDWDAFVPTIDWAGVIPDIDWRAAIRDLRWVDFIPSLYLAEFITGVDWRDRIAGIEWSDFVPAFDWDGWLTGLDWRDYLPDVDWSAFVPGLALAEYVTGVDLGEYVADIDWRAHVSDLAWSAFVGPLRLIEWVTGVDLREHVTGIDWWDVLDTLVWSAFVGPLRLADWVAGITWRDFVPTLSWSDFVPRLSLPDWVTGIDLGAYVTPTDLNEAVAPLDWDQSLDMVSLADYVTGVDLDAYVTPPRVDTEGLASDLDDAERRISTFTTAARNHLDRLDDTLIDIAVAFASDPEATSRDWLTRAERVAQRGIQTTVDVVTSAPDEARGWLETAQRIADDGLLVTAGIVDDPEAEVDAWLAEAETAASAGVPFPMVVGTDARASTASWLETAQEVADAGIDIAATFRDDPVETTQTWLDQAQAVAEDGIDVGVAFADDPGAVARGWIDDVQGALSDIEVPGLTLPEAPFAGLRADAQAAADAVDETIAGVQETLDGWASAAESAGGRVQTAMNAVWDRFEERMPRTAAMLELRAAGIRGDFQQLADVLSDVGGAIGSALDPVVEKTDEAAEAVGGLQGIVLAFAIGPFLTGLDLARQGAAAASLAIDATASAARERAQPALDAVGRTADATADAFDRYVGHPARQSLDAIGQAADRTVAVFDRFVGHPARDAIAGVGQAADDARAAFDRVVASPIGRAIDDIRARAALLTEQLRGIIPDIRLPDAQAIIGAARGLASDIIRELFVGFDVALATLIMPEKMLPEVAAWWANAGRGFMQALARGIRNSGGVLEGALRNVFSGATDWLPGSDADRGPLSDLTERGAGLVEALAAGIRAEGPTPLQQALDSVFGGLDLGMDDVEWLQEAIVDFEVNTPEAAADVFETVREGLGGVFDTEAARAEAADLSTAVHNAIDTAVDLSGSFSPDVVMPGSEDLARPQPARPSPVSVDTEHTGPSADEIGAAVARYGGREGDVMVDVKNENEIKTDATRADVQEALADLGFSLGDIENIMADVFRFDRPGLKPGRRA